MRAVTLASDIANKIVSDWLIRYLITTFLHATVSMMPRMVDNGFVGYRKIGASYGAAFHPGFM